MRIPLKCKLGRRLRMRDGPLAKGVFDYYALIFSGLWSELVKE